MKLVIFLIFSFGAYLAACYSNEGLIGELNEINHHDVLFLGAESDIINKYVFGLKTALFILSSVSYNLDSKCSAFFIQLPLRTTKVSRNLKFYKKLNIFVSLIQIDEIPCFNSEGLFVLFVEKCGCYKDIINRMAAMFEKFGVFRLTFVLFQRDNFNVAIVNHMTLFGNIESIKANGYRYRVHIKMLIPYFYYLNDKLFGLDKQLVEVIINHQNATVEYDERMEYGLWLAAHYDPEGKDFFDLSLRRSHEPVRTTLDQVYLPEWDEICVVVPKRYNRLVFLQLTKPFEIELWGLLAVLITVRFLLRRVQIKLVLLTFILLKFFIMEGYLTKAIQFLTDMKYIPDPKTMEELIDRGEVFAARPVEENELSRFGNAAIFHVDGDKERFLTRYATVYYCKTAKFFEQNAFNINSDSKKKQIFTLKERLRPFPSHYGFARNHPLKKIFEKHLRAVFESGIWRKIYDLFEIEDERFKMLLTPNELPIGFDDLYSLWIVLGLGWVVSFASFLVELLTT